MTTAGIINANINFGTTTADLNVIGGVVNGTISGYGTTNTNAININIPGGSFTVGGNIINVHAINIVSGSLVVNALNGNATVSSDINFNGARPASLVIQKGTVSGNVVAGAGNSTLEIDGGVFSGTFQGGAGSETFNINSGLVSGAIEGGSGDRTFNMNGGSLTGTITGNTGNNIFNINNGSVSENITGGTGVNQFNINGGTIMQSITSGGTENIFNLNGGAINGNINCTQGQNVLNVGTSTVAASASIAGTVSGIQTINVQNTAAPNYFTINNAVTGVNAGFSTNTGATTIIGVGGSVSGTGNITNAGVFTVSSGVGNSQAALADVTTANGVITYNQTGNVSNTGTFNIQGGTSYVGNFINQQAKAVFNVTGGSINAGNVNNAVGSITVSGGDLSSFEDGNAASILTNNAGQVITVSGSGNIGYNKAFKEVDNSGTINLEDGTFTVGTFNNQSLTAQFNISGGQAITEDITNTLGSITISGGDLSSSGSCSIVNQNGQTMTVAQPGSIGSYNSFQSLDNYGTFNLGSSNINIKNITNEANGTINVNNGGNIANGTLITDGVINLNAGGTINVPVVFGAKTTGTLNLSGGLINGVVGGSNNTYGNGTVNVTKDFTYDGINTVISNVANVKVNSGNFTINGLITGINNSFIIDPTGTVTIGGLGNVTNNVSTNITLVNAGTLTMDPGGSINVPIIFGNNGGTLNLSGGSVNAAIGGAANVQGHGIINLNQNFSYVDAEPNISNIDYFNVGAGTITINYPITTINTGFTTTQGTSVTIEQGGYISGAGNVCNAGTITLNGGTIGTGTVANGIVTPTSTMAGIINSVTLNVASNIYVSEDINNINSAAATTSSTSGVGGFGIYAAGNSTSTTNPNQPNSPVITGTININSGGNIIGTGNAMLQNLGVVTVNTGGQISILISFGAVDTGILNVNGGVISSVISGGSSGGVASSGTININNNFTYGLSGNIKNINTINVNSGVSNFTVNNFISGVNKAFTTASGTTTTINVGANITGNGLVNNAGTIILAGGNIGSNIAGMNSLENNGTIVVSNNSIGGAIYISGNIDNNSSGTLFVYPNGVVNAALINQSGTMTTNGEINAPINFGTNATTLNVNGGAINNPITGFANGVNSNVININDTFSTGSTISDVSVVNVNAGDFTVNHNVSNLNNMFSVASGATATFNVATSLTGAGSINNSGVITLLGSSISGGTVTNNLGTFTQPINDVANSGIININKSGTTNSQMVVNTFVNNSVNSSVLNATVPPGTVTSTSGSVAINVTSIPPAIDLSNKTITENVPGTQSTPENTPLTFSNANNNALTINGIFGDNVTATLTATNGAIQLGSTNGLTSYSGNGTNQVTIVGRLDYLNSAIQGLVFTPSRFYTGTANLQILATSNQPATRSSTNNANPMLDVIAGNMVVNSSITNTVGTIIIANGGNLCSLNATSPSSLTNFAGQTITVSGNGTIGATVASVLGSGALGTVNNYGTFNANGDQVTVGAINNGDPNGTTQAMLNISGTNSKVAAGNISNINGVITVGAIDVSGNPINGDLSSAGNGSSVNSPLSTLTNNAGQTISIIGAGTVGAVNQLGAVINSGTINAYGGNVNVGTVTNSGVININNNTKAVTTGAFANNNVNAILNITSGTLKISSVENTLGQVSGGINIFSGGDLSSADPSNPSSLVNAANQTINVSGGTMGGGATNPNNMLGNITNNGFINISNGGIVNCINFANNAAGANLTITGNASQVLIENNGSITNTLGTINITDNGDLSSISAGVTGSLTNNIGQTIIISNGGTIGNTAPLNSINNSGVFNMTSTANKIILNGTGTINAGGIFTVSNVNSVNQVQLGQFNNQSNINVGGTFNIYGPLTAFGGIAKDAKSIINIRANFDIGAGNLLDNSGTVNMLQAASMLNGDYTVENTGIHVVSINNNIPSTLSLPNGVATLNAGSTISIVADNTLFGGTQTFTVMAGSNPATLNLPINIIGDTDLILYNVSQSGNNIIITSSLRQTVTDTVEAVGNRALTPVAEVIDGLITNGVSGELRTALVRMEGLQTPQQVSDAVNQLSPDPNATADIWVIGPELVFNTIGERNDLVARAGINNIQTGFSAGGMQANNGIWIKGLGGFIQQKPKDTFSGYNANTAGVAFGLDRQILDDVWLGVGLSSVGTHVNSKDFPTKKTKVTSRQITLYGSYSPEDYYVDFFTAMAFNNYKLTRAIQFNGLNYTATADYNAMQPATKISSGYIYSIDDFKIIPNASIQYSSLKQNIYNESGAGGVSLQQIRNSNLVQLEGGIGVKFAVLHKEDEGKVYNPDLHFMVLHDFKSAAPTTTAQFLGGGGSFTVQGSTPDKTTYNIGAGFTFIHQDRIHFTANYELRIKNKYMGHAGSLAVKYSI